MKQVLLIIFHVILIKYNFSNYHLTDSDKSLLIGGLNFAIPPEKTEYSKFLLPFEFLFRDIKSNSEYSVDLASIKYKSTFKRYSVCILLHL